MFYRIRDSYFSWVEAFSSWWVHVRWTDGLKALPMMMALDALTDIDRADHNALHSANAPTRHRARLQPAQACFAIFSVLCSTWGRRPFMFSPQSTLGRLAVKWLQLVWRHHHPLIIARQNSNELKMTWLNVVGSRRHRSIFCSQVIKSDDNTQEHNESAGANLFWRKPKKIWSYSALYEDNTPHMCTTLILENKIIEHCVKW